MKTQSLVERYAEEVEGVLECFDRVILFGTYKAIAYPEAMDGYLYGNGISRMDFLKQVANQWREQVAAQIRREAAAADVPVRQTQPSERKEAIVARILATRGNQPGVVCVLGAMERCRGFASAPRETEGCRLQWRRSYCQHFYIYFIDAEFGLCYLRVPTWAPFRLQFYCNGHDWLERRMQAAGITFEKVDNCFRHVSDYAAAQALVGQFDLGRLHLLLTRTAARWVEVHPRFGYSLSWSIFQAEWSTDIVFRDERFLPALYREIVRTAAVEIGCPDIYRFLGKRPHARIETPESRLQTLVQGTRLKHTLGPTVLKMYDKAGQVLRLECATSDVSTFPHHRKVEPRRGPAADPRQPQGQESGTIKWAPMRKHLESLVPLGQALSACTQRYLAHISQWRDQTKERHALCALSASRRDAQERSVRGLNFFSPDDLAFLHALERGEHQIRGLRNRTLQPYLPGWKPAKIGRALRRFRVLKLIKRVPKSRKYYPTPQGQRVLVAGLQITERVILPSFTT
jgi:hypothetical protein